MEIVTTDVSDVAQVRALMDKTKKTFGRIDILVNNAGWAGNSMALDTAKVVKDFAAITTHMHLKDYSNGKYTAGYCPLGMGFLWTWNRY